MLRSLALALAVLAPLASEGDEPRPSTSKGDAAETSAKGQAEVHKPGEPDPTMGGTALGEVAPADVRAARVEAQARLDAPAAEAKPRDADAAKRLVEALTDRLRLLGEWEQAAKERAEFEHPRVATEADAARLKADLEGARAELDQAAKDPSGLLPEAFRARPGRVTEALLAEMKEAIDAAQAELDRKAEGSGTASERKGAVSLSAMKAERDEIHRQCAALVGRRGDRAAAVTAAETAEARALATEALANVEWEARVAAERLRAKEAQIALEGRRAAVEELGQQVVEARREVAKRTLKAMQDTYRVLLDRKQIDLEHRARHEEARAITSSDPLERFRARANADLLDLNAQLLKEKKLLEAGPALSAEEQKELADRAEQDFANLRSLVEGGHSGALVALRLKNDFRRLSYERATVSRTDLARAAG
jgi:hypothetical protein